MVDLHTKKCYVTRDIVFKENIYPFQDINHHTEPMSNTSNMFPLSPLHLMSEDTCSPYITQTSSNSETSSEINHNNVDNIL